MDCSRRRCENGALVDQPRVGARFGMAVPFLACMALVARIYDLPPRVLPSIQQVEGGSPGLVHRNRDGSSDLGVMQVNTLWLPALARYTRTSTTTVARRLRDEPCYNIAAGGAILRTYLAETRGDLMHAIGDYHSHTAALNRIYQQQVMRAATVMFVTRAPIPRPRGKQR